MQAKLQDHVSKSEILHSGPESSAWGPGSGRRSQRIQDKIEGSDGICLSLSTCLYEAAGLDTNRVSSLTCKTCRKPCSIGAFVSNLHL